MMMTGDQTIQMTRRAMAKAGASLPDQIQTAEAHAEQLLADLDGALGAEQSIANAVVQALEANRNPVTDKAVNRAIAAREVQQLRATTRATLDAQVGAVWLDNLDELVEALRPSFDDAAATLTTAHQQLGSKALDIVDGFGRGNGSVVSATFDALARMDALAHAWHVIASLAAGGPTAVPILSNLPTHRGIWCTLHPTPAQWTDHPPCPTTDGGASRQAWAALSEGYELHLATIGEARQFVAALAAEQQQRAAARRRSAGRRD